MKWTVFSLTLKRAVFIALVALHIPSYQLRASDNLNEAVKIVGLSAGFGGLFCVVDQAYYHNRFCSSCASYMDYEKFLIKGMTEGVKIGALLAAVARVGSRSQLGWQDCIIPLGVVTGGLLCADILAQERGYKKAYNNPEFANQVINKYPEKLLAQRDPQNDTNEKLKKRSSQLAAVDYSYSLLSKSTFVVSGGLMLYTALQRYQRS